MVQIVVLAIADPNIHYLLRRYVEESGLQAIAASCGDVVETVLRARPALIIAEAGCGEIQSSSLRTLGHHPDTRQIPLLLYGSEDCDCVGEDAPPLPQSAAGYLHEYVTYDQFLAALHQIGVGPQEEAPHP